MPEPKDKTNDLLKIFLNKAVEEVEKAANKVDNIQDTHTKRYLIHAEKYLGISNQYEQRRLNRLVENYKSALRENSSYSSKEQGLLQSAIRRKEYELTKNQIKERIIAAEGHGSISQMARARYEQMRNATNEFFVKTTGVQSASFLKYAGWVGLISTIVEDIVEELARGMGLLYTGMSLNVRMGRSLSSGYSMAAATMDGLRAAAMRSGMTMTEMTDLVSLSTNEYVSSLYSLRAGQSAIRISNETDQERANLEIIHQTENLKYIGNAVGIGAEAAIKQASTLGRMYGIPLEELASSFGRMSLTAEAAGIHTTDFSKILEAQGETLAFTDKTFDNVLDDTLMFKNMLVDQSVALQKTTFWGQKFQALLPEMMTRGIEAFGKISPEAYMAYLGKPVTEIGKAYTEAVSAGPIQKMLVMTDRLRTEFKGLAPEEMAGRIAMFPEFRSLGALGPKITTAIVNMSEKERAELAKQPTQDQFDKVLGKIPKQQVGELEKLGINMARFGDPMKYIANLFTVFIRSWFVLAAHFGTFVTDGPTRQELSRMGTKTSRELDGSLGPFNVTSTSARTAFEAVGKK